MFVYGGRTTDNLILADGYLLDISTWTWTKVQHFNFFVYYIPVS